MRQAVPVLALCILILAVLACSDGDGPPLPTATPRADVRDELLIRRHTYSRPGLDYFVVKGELQNTGHQTWRFVQVSATGYDSGGGLVDTDTSYIDVDRLRPGDYSAFTVYLDEDRPIARYKVTVVSGDAD